MGVPWSNSGRSKQKVQVPTLANSHQDKQQAKAASIGGFKPTQFWEQVMEWARAHPSTTLLQDPVNMQASTKRLSDSHRIRNRSTLLIFRAYKVWILQSRLDPLRSSNHLQMWEWNKELISCQGFWLKHKRILKLKCGNNSPFNKWKDSLARYQNRGS